MRHRCVVTALFAVVSLATGSCGDGAGPESTAPVPGTLLVSVTPPVQAEGALLVQVTSDRPRTVEYETAHYDLRVYPRQVTDQELRLILVGVIRTVTIIAVAVSDVSDLSAYHVTVLEGTKPDGQLVPGNAYGVSVTKATGPVSLHRFRNPAGGDASRP